jgi:lipoprotein-releasing system permease protein
VITALFEMGMAEYDRTMVFMPLLESQRYFSRNGEVDAIEVIIEHPSQIDEFVRLIKTAVAPANHVSDWRVRNETFFTVLEVERNVMFIILSLIVLVAALNIISGLMMLVKDKGRDVAILRTMGATRGSMMRVFLITGASIGVVGTIAGLILGVVFCLNIESIRELVSYVTGTLVFDPNVYYLTRLPAEMEPRDVATIVGMALALSVLATLYPSWRASTLDPVEALRYE